MKPGGSWVISKAFGGPVSQKFIDRQTDLQQKMLRRMRELGMAPVFQGFYGMVPNSLKEKFPEANIKEQGEWQTYQRPAFLDPNDPLFDKIARHILRRTGKTVR